MKKNISGKHRPMRILFKPRFTQTINSPIRKFNLLVVVFAVCTLASCKKDEKQTDEEFVKAKTSIRLVHTSFMLNPFMPGMTPIETPTDLYVDGVKVNTGGPITFPNASAYFPLASGERKIEAKDETGSVLADTTITIKDGFQYSFYLKDRSEVNATSNTLIDPLERRLIPVIDNNTTIPRVGKAKVKFVNATSLPINSIEGAITFMTVNKVSNTAVTNILTQSLGGDKNHVIFKSDFVSLDAGDVILRAQSINGTALDSKYVVDLSTTFEAGKLYTVYVISTIETVKTPTKSPIALKIIRND